MNFVRPDGVQRADSPFWYIANQLIGLGDDSVADLIEADVCPDDIVLFDDIADRDGMTEHRCFDHRVRTPLHSDLWCIEIACRSANNRRECPRPLVLPEVLQCDRRFSGPGHMQDQVPIRELDLESTGISGACEGLFQYRDEVLVRYDPAITLDDNAPGATVSPLNSVKFGHRMDAIDGQCDAIARCWCGRHFHVGSTTHILEYIAQPDDVVVDGGKRTKAGFRERRSSAIPSPQRQYRESICMSWHHTYLRAVIDRIISSDVVMTLEFIS